MKLIIRCSQNINDKISEKGTIRINKINHHINFSTFTNKNIGITDNTLSYSSILTSHENIKLNYNGKKIVLDSTIYKWPEKRKNISSFHNIAFVENSKIKFENHNSKWSEDITRKMVLTNFILASLEKKNYLEIFKKNDIKIENLNSNEILIDNLTNYKNFSLLNSNTKFVINELDILKNKFCPQNDSELDEMRSCANALLDLNTNDYNNLLSIENDLKLEREIGRLVNFNKIIF